MSNDFLDNVYGTTFITLVFIFVHSCTIATQQLGSLYHSKKNKLMSILQSLFCIYSTHAPKQRTHTVHIMSVSIIVISCTLIVKNFEHFFWSQVTIKFDKSDVITTTSLTIIKYVFVHIIINGLRLKSLFCIYSIHPS